MLNIGLKMLEFNPEKHEYKWEGQLRPCPSNFIAPYRDFSKINKQVLADKQAFGKTVHNYTVAYDLGLLDMDNLPVDETGLTDIRAILQSWIKFQAGLDKSKFTVLETKTSQPHIATEVQLAFYVQLAIENPEEAHNWIDHEPGLYSKKYKFAGMPDRVYGYATDMNYAEPTILAWHVNEMGKDKVVYYDYRKGWNQAQCLMSNYNYFKE
jgi:hypothetical protein